MKAVLCPVCLGKGKIGRDSFERQLTGDVFKTCHGCYGRGWVGILEDVYFVPKTTDKKEAR